MKKGYIIGGLAVLGAIALISWYKKPKKNSEGFFGANGRTSKLNSVTGCTVCAGASSNYWAQNGTCREGDKCKR